MAGPALEIGEARQRPVDAGRGHFEIVGAGDRVLDVEHRRDGAARRLAFVDAEGSVGALGHDLQGRRAAAGDLHPHQAEAETLQHRADDGGDARRRPGLGHETRLVEAARIRAAFRGAVGLAVACILFAHRPRRIADASRNAKRAGPGGGTHSQSTTRSFVRYLDVTLI